MLKIYVSTDFLELDCDIMYPENSKHPIKQVEYIKNLFKENKFDEKSIATNSPYILQAVRYYAAKEGVEDKVAYYDKTEEGIKEITNTLNDAFVTFAYPLNNIMNVDQTRKGRISTWMSDAEKSIKNEEKEISKKLFILKVIQGMEENNITQEEFANMLGLSSSVINRFLHGL